MRSLRDARAHPHPAHYARGQPITLEDKGVLRKLRKHEKQIPCHMRGTMIFLMWPNDILRVQVLVIMEL